VEARIIDYLIEIQRRTIWLANVSQYEHNKIMKSAILNLTVAAFVVASFQVHAQDTLIYDQQSATNGVSLYATGVEGLDIQGNGGLDQSFVPTLSAIGFVQLEFWDIPGNGTNGARVSVLLLGSSPNGQILGSTAPVYMPDGFSQPGLGGGGITNFYFSPPVVLTPGQTYYLLPDVMPPVYESGGRRLGGDNPWDIIAIGNTYPNGQLFEQGVGWGTDLWFREGVLPVPQIENSQITAPSGNFAFTIDGVTNEIVVVEASTNLVDWQPVWTNTLSGASATFADSQWTNYPVRYYRAR
jgi:hypothetical protein